MIEKAFFVTNVFPPWEFWCCKVNQEFNHFDNLMTTDKKSAVLGCLSDKKS